MIEIIRVNKKSPAKRAGITAGDLLCSINGNPIADVLDYMFFSAEKQVCVSVKRDGSIVDFSIRKGEYDDLGLEFETFLMDKKRSCKNNCVFCFIDQLPKGMREALYFKDDDSRLSFLQGNYITLTNLCDKDAERIIKMKLPMNISVHTTNPELRCKMMNNRFAGEKLGYLFKLANAGISINCQIVLCPGLNDGIELEHTLSTLCSLAPAVTSIAVVPVGITSHRNGLAVLKPVDAASAAEVITTVEKYQAQMLKKSGTRLVYAADEFYLLADKKLPSNGEYEDFPQYENGVGMLSLLISEFSSALSEFDGIPDSAPKYIATGAAAYDTIESLLKSAKKRFPAIDCSVYKIENRFFGQSITVTGLLTAKDIIAQLKGRVVRESTLLLSKSMLRANDNIFLDDLSVADVESALGVSVRVVGNDGFELFDAIVG